MMHDDIAQTVRELARPTRPALTDHVVDMVELRQRVAGYLDEETSRWLSTMPAPSRDIASALIRAGGKRLRPMLSFLVAGAAGGDWLDARPVAVAVELLHTGTLLHDDVIDRSDTRRGATAAHVDWDNSVAILTGDFCYFAALDALLTLRDVTTMECAMRVARQLAHGELVQLARLRRPPASVTRAECLKIMERKTASLFEFATLAAARATAAPPATLEGAAQFGWSLGMAFQIIDDVLDYTGDADALGKATGQDTAQGAVTLPLVLACEADPSLLELLDRPERLRDAVLQSGALEQSKRMAKEFTCKARRCLAPFEDTEEVRVLHWLADELEHRAS